MPASPSFHSDGRGKWKRRKREPQINRRSKLEDDDDEEEEDNGADVADGSENIQRDEQTGEPNYGAVSGKEVEVLDEGGQRICEFPAAVKREVKRPHQSVAAIVALERANLLGESRNQLQNSVALENVSYGQLQALSALPSDSEIFDQDAGNSSYVVKPPRIMESCGVVKRFGDRYHVLPVHSDWFSPSTVHQLERQLVPHFFSGKSTEHTPEKFVECRNYIVSTYMENPEKRLVAADCQELVSGIDTEDLNRIVRFLDHWGIINYCAASPCHENLSSESNLRENANGEIQVPSDGLKSIDSLIRFDRPKCKLKAADVYSSSHFHNDEAAVPDLDNKIREQLCDNCCNYCSKPVPNIFYQSQKEVDIVLCSNCFHEGRLVTGHSSLDFVKMDSTKDISDQDMETWTDQETLLLLEAMELYNENWNEIAEHVGTKSKAQCILHFLRLPMEDGLLENVEVPITSTSPKAPCKNDRGKSHLMSNGRSRGSCLQDVDSPTSLPFSDSENPVMSLVAFLASAIGPRVAAACAHAALGVLSEDNGHGSRMNLKSINDGDGGHGGTANSVGHKEKSSGIDGSRGKNEVEFTPLSAEKVKAAARAGLAAAATKTKLFADHEEREIQRLSANIINHQFKRLEVKLKQFAELEALLMKECEQVERFRQRFATERARILSTRSVTAGVTQPVGPAMVNNAGTSRQQAMSASSSQPNISGYNNQPMHPNMSFMPRQQGPMYGFGPRLPLTAIQSSTSAPPNAFFNSAANSQPTLNPPMMRSVPGTSSGLG